MPTKYIFQTWHTKYIPTFTRECYEHNSRICNIDKNIVFKRFTLQECENYLINNHDPKYIHTHKKIKPLAFKSDFWRLCILYKEGGTYMDSKLRILNVKKYLNLLNSNEECLIRDRPDWIDFKNKYNNKYHLGINNQLIIVKKNNPFIKLVMDNILENVKNNYYGPSCLHVTGPGLLGKLYERNNFTNPIIIDFPVWKQIVWEYSMYRKELKKFTPNVPNYYNLWRNRDIYNNI